MLDDRKLKVLYAIINSHLLTAEPIGSRTISKEYNLGVSPATIRNEMSDLEDKGYLSKPHSSAGRVPSDKAYRLYVNEILKVNMPAESDKHIKVKEILYRESKEVDDLIQNAARVLSSLTSYTAIALSPNLNTSKLKHIQIISIAEDRMLMVIINSSGLVRNTIFRLDEKIGDEDLMMLSNFLNEKFRGLTIDQIVDRIQLEKFQLIPNMEKILQVILPIISDALKDISDMDIYSEGITKILNYPEYNDLEKAKSFISFIEDKDTVIDLMLGTNQDEEDVDIVIGNENIYEPLKDCSLITANYKLGDKTIGRIGIVGPTRMDYFNLINILKGFSIDISEVLFKMIE